jgi:glycosyltransferase involved in cell wall biosynthesis
MIDNCLFSIIVPVYNGELYIAKCLTSILSQTFKNFEVLVVDDGSKDSTNDIIKGFVIKDKRIKLINQNNSGVSVARNTGIKKANGKYILFIDSDDYVLPTYLENLNNQSNEFDLLVTGYSTFGEHEKTMLPSKTGVIQRDEIIRLLFTDEAVSGFPWNKVFLKSILIENEIFFDESIFFAEDLLFALSYISKIECGYVLDTSDYYYFNHQDSATSKITTKRKFLVRLTYIDAMKKSLLLLSNNYQHEQKIINSEIAKSGAHYYQLSYSFGWSKSDRKKLKKEIDPAIFNYIFDKDYRFKSLITKFKVLVSRFSPLLYNYIYTRFKGVNNENSN